MKLFLRAGHGSSNGDPGAVSSIDPKYTDAGVSGNVVNLIAQKLKGKVPIVVSAKPYNTDDDYYEARRQGCNLILFIHCNSSVNSSANGSETFYNHDNFEGYGTSLLNYFARAMGFSKRGCALQEKVYAMTHTDIPILLLEMGFLSNWGDLQKLKAQQDYCADAVVHWILGQCSTDVKEYTFQEGTITYMDNNNHTYNLMSPVRVIQGRTYLPLRDIANLTGKKAGYLPGVKKIILF